MIVIIYTYNNFLQIFPLLFIYILVFSIYLPRHRPYREYAPLPYTTKTLYILIVYKFDSIAGISINNTAKFECKTTTKLSSCPCCV